MELVIIRNGVLSSLRARGRVVLFTLLIFGVTVSLSLGLGMWAYCAQMLQRCDENYTSIALVEYMGTDYPEEDAADGYAREAFGALDGEAIAAVDGVQLWESADRTLASLEGYSRTYGDMPYEDMGVLVASVLSEPITEERYVYYQEDELPDTYVAELYSDDGTLLSEMRVYSGAGEPDILPVYYYQLQDGRYRHAVVDSVSGATELEYLTEEELPEAYVAAVITAAETSWRVHYDGPVDPTDPALERYRYDPAADAVCRLEQVVVGYDGLVARTLYTSEREPGLVTITFEEAGFQPEPGKYYLLHGTFYDSELRGGTGFGLTEFYEGCDTPPWLEVSGPDDPAVTSGIFAEYAERYRIGDNYIRLEASADIASLEPFQQGALSLAEGRFPQAGEPGVCLLSGTAADKMGVGLGDTVHVSRLASDEDDRFDLSGTGEEKELTVVGITNQSIDYDGCVWVSDAEGDFGGSLYGYQLGRAVLDNAQGRQAVETLQAMMPDQVRVTLYDQGYSAAAQPLETLRTTALAVTLAAAAGALAVLVLFAFLFVGRQRETVQILASLGTPKGKIALWLLSGGALLSGAAALLGGLAGGLLLDRVIAMALTAAQGLYTTDLRYSEAAVGLSQALDYSHAPLVWPALASALSVFVLALALCLLFLGQARRQDQPKQGKLKVRTPRGGTSTAGRGVLRFAVRNIRRGGMRSGVVPAAALVLSLLLGLLGSTAQDWQRQLASVCDNTRLSAQATSTDGRYFSGLILPGETVRQLNDSGLVEDLHVSTGYHYWLDGEMPNFGDGNFSQATREAWIARQPELVALNGLDAAPEFFYADPEVEWLEGWDESALQSQDYRAFYTTQNVTDLVQTEGPERYPALVSRSFLTSHGLKLGDQLQVMMEYTIGGSGWEATSWAAVDLEIVGVFQPHSTQNHIYVPLAFVTNPADLFGEEDPFGGLAIPEIYRSMEEVADYFRYMTRYGTCRFALSSARDLEALRDWLEEHDFGQVGGARTSRTAVLIRDGAFTQTVESLGRYISFGRLLFPILLVVVAVLGFVISWLMVNARRMELALMRGLGVPRGKVFWTFFLEQALLCLLGCLLGCGALALLGSGGALQWLAAAGFAVCYLLGCALSVLAVGRVNLMNLLSERE